MNQTFIKKLFSALIFSILNLSSALAWSPTSVKKDQIQKMKHKLTSFQLKVIEEGSTEPPFKNAFWNSKEDGIYVDQLTGEPLFSSLDKFDSKTGWPSFTQPLVSQNVVERTHQDQGDDRTEVRSKYADSHLGHVFKDGPTPTGFRYCINSASLRFIPKEKLREENYEEFMVLFSQKKKELKP